MTIVRGKGSTGPMQAARILLTLLVGGIEGQGERSLVADQEKALGMKIPVSNSPGSHGNNRSVLPFCIE